ncbi:MAG: DUF1553 domain-containing protein [Planctomyces sp.]
MMAEALLRRLTIPLLMTLISSLTESTVLAADDASAVFFEQSVRPILKEHCWHCHGEDGRTEAQLDARLTRLLLKGGESGPSIEAGSHKTSLLYQRVSSGEMPPGKKKLSADQLAVIARWIDEGARTRRPEPEQIASDSLFTDEDRNHWAFQPITRPPAPAHDDTRDNSNPIDAFVLEKLKTKGISFSERASKEVLIRRASFDLTGLPPEPEAVEAFCSSDDEDAWPKLIDSMLESPHYGERWGRHWLDIAGYADSDGYSEADSVRPWAWKYRDYVIRSFNSDKPWDQFVLEQIAGDELTSPPWQNLTAEQADQLTATGFLRMGPDGTADSAVDQNVARNEVVADTIRIVSTSLLGLSVGCAQCHEHRYDPITHEDYYRLRAIFEPAYDWQNWRGPSNRLLSMWSEETRGKAAEIDQELSKVSSERTAELDVIVKEVFERELQKLPSDLQEPARTARVTPADKQTEEQKQLIREYPFLNVDRGSVYLYVAERINAFNAMWDKKTEEVKSRRPPEDLVMCLTEVPGQIPVTRVFSRGDYRTPAQDVLPGELAILNPPGHEIPSDDPNLPTSGRRLAYAKYLTSGRHPLLARVLVNRFWLHHFGRGLVDTPADFGVKGEPPTHPELLDWLAAEFMSSGWSLKKMHRLILTSEAWRQSSTRRPELEMTDPDNRWLGRMSVRRLEAEVVRDATLLVSGQLTRKPYGPAVPVSPDDVGQIVLGADTRDSAGRPTGAVVPPGEDAFRRSIYVQVRRTMPLGVLEPFDFPAMTPNCERRPSSTTPSQSLMMLNNPFTQTSAQRLADRLKKEAGESPDAQIRRAWKIVFGKMPSATDIDTALKFLSAPADPSSETPDPNSLVHYCHALLSSNGFLYVD